ncbi:MAG: AAA family ATPase [Cyanobacteria bacterium J06631_9]
MATPSKQLSDRTSDIVTYNKNSLNNLRRAVVLGQGQFSLILARVNYQRLRQVLLTELNEHLQLDIVNIPPEATNLRETITASQSSASRVLSLPINRPKALMLTGIENVSAKSPYPKQPSPVEKLLRTANLGRDELLKRFPYPVVLWVNDTVLQQLNRYAPDLKNFAATPLRFEYPAQALMAVLSEQATETFTQILNVDKGIVPRYRLPLSTSITEPLLSRELAFALVQLEQLYKQQSNQNDELVSDSLLADLLFLQGRNLHLQRELTRAKNYYEDSLLHWQQVSSETTTADPQRQVDTITPQDKQAVLLFHLGLWWRTQAALGEQDSKQDYVSACQQARQQFEQCLAIFRQQNRPDRIGRFILALADVLQKLEDWDELGAIAQESTRLHTTDPARLARDYGYLSEVALARYKGDSQSAYLSEAQGFAQQALEMSDRAIHQLNAERYALSQEAMARNELTIAAGEERYRAKSDDILAARTALRYHRGCYFYLLAIAQQLQGQSREALSQLELALQNTDPRYDLSLYRRILNRLWHLYYKHKHYAEAFEVKLEQRRIETLFGLRAFIGASQIQPLHATNSSTADYVSIGKEQSVNRAVLAAEIKASGRTKDIEALVTRLSQPRYPIVVLHGQSGVGKSSILQAGLVPRLRNLMSEGRTTLPVLVTNYTPWAVQLARAISSTAQNASSAAAQTTETVPSELVTEIENLSTQPGAHTKIVALLTQSLKQLTQSTYQQVILILDQFEDFFYEYPSFSKRQGMYAFLRNCLDLPYVKIVLALREDFLHYLLEWDRNADLNTIDNDILNKEIRYYLGNFTPKAAESLILQLTRSAGFHPEEPLVTALVDDLAAETGEVRPIELQVVGAQLQRESIITLEQYRDLGRSPKTQLLNNFLNSVIRDCGPENKEVAQSVLYLLSEGDNRPLKSLTELHEPLILSTEDSAPQQLSLVLDILIGSGLVFEVPEVSGARYQLVHEYLSGLIQEQQQPGLIDALQTERQRRQLTEDQLQKALMAQSDSLLQATLARQKIKVAEIKALTSVAKSLQLSGNSIEALAKALRAARQVSSVDNALLKMQTVLCLREILYQSREKNSLEGHRNWVLAVACSPTEKIVSASEDSTLKLWNRRGELLTTFTGHTAGILDVCFSPDGQHMASASLDHAIRLWQVNGTCLKEISLAAASVTSLAYSPAAALIAAAYSDTHLRLWNLEGELVRTFEGHDDWVRTVAFSPDGQLIASGGEDRTVRIWSVAGELLHTLYGHRGWIRSVAFSPDGQLIVSAGDANEILLWRSSGQKLKTFYGHDDWVRTVAFNPAGDRIASGSDDQTIRVWTLDGKTVAVFDQRSSVHSLAWQTDGTAIVAGGDDDCVHIWQLAGPTIPICYSHQGIVWSACYQKERTPPSAGKELADLPPKILSAGDDDSIRLWSHQGELLKTIAGHQRGVHSVDWSPNGGFFASASADYSVKIWQEDGTLVRTLVGHGDAVWQVRYSPEGDRLASVSSDRTLRLWDTKGTLLNTWSNHTDTVWHVSFSPDGRHLITASEDNTLRLWHHENGLLQTIQQTTIEQTTIQQTKIRQTTEKQTTTETTSTNEPETTASQSINNPLVPSSHGVWCTAFSPDGQWIASGGASGIIRLWSVLRLEPNKIRLSEQPILLKGHRDCVRSLCFSPKGDFLASASDDETVRLWSMSSTVLNAPKTESEDTISQLLPPLVGHEGVVWDVDFDNSGGRLISASTDGTVRVWELNLDVLMSQSCQWLDDWLLAHPDLRQQICERRE